MLGVTNYHFSGEVFVLMLPVPVSHRSECLLEDVKRFDQDHITGLTKYQIYLLTLVFFPFCHN